MLKTFSLASSCIRLLPAVGLAVVAATAGPTAAHAINYFNFSISYTNLADPELAASPLTGEARFWYVPPGTNDVLPQPVGSAINVGSIAVGGNFSTSFAPTEPCNQLTSCDIGFSFAGQTQSAPVFGFDSLPAAWPTATPISYFARLIPTDPCNGCTASGILAANLSTGTFLFVQSLIEEPSIVQVGTRSASITPEPIPVPAALPLFATGVAALAYAGRRKRKAAQMTD